MPSGGATAVAGSKGIGMARTSTAPTDEDAQGKVRTELKFDAEVGQREIGVGRAEDVSEVDHRIVVRH